MKEKFLKYFKGDTTIWIIVFLLSLVSMLGGVLAVNRRETPQLPAGTR